MGWLGTLRSVGEAVGVVGKRTAPVGCSLGRVVFRETKRAAFIANVNRRARPLQPRTQAMLRELLPDLDPSTIRIRTKCRLPSNRFRPTGHIYAMTFGSNIFFRDELDESDPVDLVHLIHESVHVDQVRRLGGESAFACAYGKGYLDGGGEVPAHIHDVSAYHRNPLEAEAYTFEMRFRDQRGRVLPANLPHPV